MSNEGYFIAYVVVSLIAIVVLAVLVAKKKHCSEGYKKCTCSSAGKGRFRSCQDTDVIQNLYKQGVLTEFTDLAAIQQAQGGPQWGRVSPGDINFPVSQGCAWSGANDKPCPPGMKGWIEGYQPHWLRGVPENLAHRDNKTVSVSGV
jgi:hypothetical protein